VLSRIFPSLVEKVRKPFKIFSLIFFIAIVVAALGANWQNFINYVGLVFIGVLIHNALALNLGFWAGRLFRLSEQDVRAVSIEVGIQNSGLGLVLIFNFFGGIGGMAIITAWWGIWHIIAGLMAAFIFSRRRLPQDARQPA
jgi:BASS family bile acid:Na+ symporter